MSKIFFILIVSTITLAQNYRFSSLGSFGGTYTLPLDISEKREVVGWGFDEDFNQIGFYWANNRFRAVKIRNKNSNVVHRVGLELLASIDGNFYLIRDRFAERVLSIKFPKVFTPGGMNENLSVVGTISDYGSYPIKEVPIKIENRKVKKLLENGTATAISSVTVGRTPHPNTGRDTAIIFKEEPTYLSPESFTSKAVDINNKNEILLSIKDRDNTSHYAKVLSGNSSRIIGNLGINWTIPISINNNGVVLAKSMYLDGREGWLIDNHGDVFDISAFVSNEFGYGIDKLTGINDRGDIIGSFYRDINNERFFKAGILTRL